MKDREAWCAAVHEVAKSWTWPSDWTTANHGIMNDSSPLKSCVHDKSHQSCPTFCDLMECSLLGTSPGKNTGVGCHALLQGIFPNQETNPSLFTSPALAGRVFTTSTPRRHLPPTPISYTTLKAYLLSSFHPEHYVWILTKSSKTYWKPKTQSKETETDLIQQGCWNYQTIHF